MKISDSNSLFFYLLFNFFCFSLLVFLLYFYRNPFPYSDEWNFISKAIGAEPFSWNWVWAQHSDHRIPIQKIFQIALLRLTGCDFGFLILANAILVFITANLLIYTARVCRGNSQVGDLIIPLILMNPGFGPFIWSFHFQFMFSTLLSLIFLVFFMQNNTRLRDKSYMVGAICIPLMALCGMNGVVLSVIMSVLFLPYLILVRPINNKFTLYVIAIALISALIISLIIISGWSPTGASSLGGSVFLSKVYDAARIYYYLINPCPVIIPGRQIFFIFNGVLYVIALVFLAKRIWGFYQVHRFLFINDIVALVTFMAVFGVQLSIAIGRAEYWSSGLESHYGYLATVLPIVSWIVVSVCQPKKIGVMIGSALVFLYGYIYIENVKWRIAFAKENRQKVISIRKDILNGMKIGDFVGKYNNFFYYVDNSDTRQIVKNGLIGLKHAKVEPYAYLQLD